MKVRSENYVIEVTEDELELLHEGLTFLQTKYKNATGGTRSENLIRDMRIEMNRSLPKRMITHEDETPA